MTFARGAHCLVFVACLVACGSSRRGEPVHRPAIVDSAEERQGEWVFYRFCHSCHPQGASGLGPALNNEPLPHFAIRLQVRNGVGAMPAFSDREISDGELDALLVFLDVLKDADRERRDRSEARQDALHDAKSEMSAH